MLKLYFINVFIKNIITSFLRNELTRICEDRFNTLYRVGTYTHTYTYMCIYIYILYLEGDPFKKAAVFLCQAWLFSKIPLVGQVPLGVVRIFFINMYNKV